MSLLWALALSARFACGLAIKAPFVHEGWSGFSSLETFFIFGDSYTSTGFSPSGTPPTPQNPLGNPAYPGDTFSNGPNWVDYLTTKCNSSVVLTYNLANGGAVVDSAIIPSPAEPVVSLRGQVHDRFNVYYGAENSSVTWAPARTLFAIWIGINDVDSAYADPAWHDLMRRAVQVYADIVKHLHSSGARNFLFLAVPQLDKAQLIKKEDPESMALNIAAVEEFNDEVQRRVVLRAAGTLGVNVWWLDTHALFSEVMQSPGTYPETKGYRNMTDYCVVYASGTPTPDTLDPSCGVRADEYLWLNEIHPTAPIHALVARKAAELLA